MIQIQPISFSDEKFNLDYLTFNLPNSIERISEIAEIFYRYGFNSKIYDVETEKTTIILEDKSFGHTLTFRLENIRNRTETPLLMQAVLNGAEQAGYMDGIIFLNYE